ncbi:MAG: NAD-dependent protein deacetylase [Gemmatimonadota bacterium]
MRPFPAPSGSIGLRALDDLLRQRRVVVLAGAGCSTESGIPDYRGPNGSLRKRPPIQYGEFVRRSDARLRYWARSAVGWQRFSGARPNPAHGALARLEDGGVVRGVITQNVDGLHQAAGSRRVVELHGSLAFVRCLECGRRETRAGLQDRLHALNGGWFERMARGGAGGVKTAPDGDAELPEDALEGFRVPVCCGCGGMLKPDVVLFGENVPAATVDDAWRLFDEGDVLLVVGSSLTVYSGRRFIYRAEQRGMPIGINNVGPTRADAVAAAKVEGRLGMVLPRLAERLLNARGGVPGGAGAAISSDTAP